MLASLFVKKIIFFLTTGTILFYLISFNSVGQVSAASLERKVRMDCQETVHVMNYADLYTLRKDVEVSSRNILKFTLAEQRAVNQFLKSKKIGLIKHGEAEPVELTTYIYKAKNSKNLGYKIVVHAMGESDKASTFMTGPEGNILFTHTEGLMSSKKWNCETTQYLK